MEHAKSLLKCYNFFGLDHCPGFNGISIAFGLTIFNEMCQSRIPSDSDDFLKLILSVNEAKNKTLKRLFDAKDDNWKIEEKILHTR